MDEHKIAKMKRHLGMDKVITIGEDTFNIPPLPMEYLPDLMELAGKFSGDEKELAKNMDKDTIKRVIELIKVSLAKSPDIETSDKEVLDSFIARNFPQLLGAMIEASTAGFKEYKK
jgi:hypothetical protein